MITFGESEIAGRGVFATSDIATGAVIETCPVLVLPPDDVARIDETLIYEYYFAWPDGRAGLALGYGSLYNHSDEPNARYLKDADAQTVVITAIRDIAAGEEITFSYSGQPPQETLTPVT